MSAGAPPVLAIDVAPLGERFHTGIANVAKYLAREALRDPDVEPLFFMNRAQVPRALVEALLDLDSGDVLWWKLSHLAASPDFGRDLNRPHIALYPATKTHRRLFPFEAQIVHDLTTLVTPQHHTGETNRFWQSRMQADLLSSDLIVAVSQSTLADVHDYFPAARNIPHVVAPLAPCCGEALAPGDGREVEPYVLVLGTLEPRKNVGVVLQTLSNHPALLDRAKFVFVGRWGWGAEAQEIVAGFGLEDEVRRGRILFTGFVGEAAKNQLLANAGLLIYPSRYEGFGLPVLEALSFGVPVVTSYSSSLMEAGGPHAVYADFDSADALAALIEAQLSSRNDANLRTARKVWARRFTWEKTYTVIKTAALRLARP